MFTPCSPGFGWNLFQLHSEAHQNGRSVVWIDIEGALHVHDATSYPRSILTSFLALSTQEYKINNAEVLFRGDYGAGISLSAPRVFRWVLIILSLCR